MRQVVRPVITLPTLTGITNRYGEGWKQTGAGGPRGAVWNEPDVRGALYAMHGRACAYCQQNLPENDRGDVEHFRPQSLYHWLAYTFENYLLSCSVCNRTFKRDRFPLRRGKRPTTYAKRRRLPLEERLLLDPSADPIEACIEYDISRRFCPAVVRPNLPPRIAEQVDATIAFFGLNLGRPPLVRDRLAKIDEVRKLLEGLDAGTAENRRKLKQAASRYRPHGVVARKALANRPELLPAPEEELEILVAELCEDLAVVEGLQPARTDRKRFEAWERMQGELLFALATLWHAPPCASPAQVGQWLAVRNLQQRAAPFLAKISGSGP